MKNFEELQKLTLEWAKDKDLLHANNTDKQFMKFIEEVFEFKTEYDIFCNDVKRQGSISKEKIKPILLEMGDIFVTLIVLCNQIGIEPIKCLDMAYEKIKDRTGKTIDGVFVKEEDLNGNR